MLQPLRRRVWAPQGRTPLQYAWNRHERITALAAVTRAPWADRLGMYYELLDHNARTADFVRFVREVHAHLRHPLTLVCDRLPAHRSAVRGLTENGASWLHVEWLPGYAPDLDPTEDVWNQSKYNDLVNIIPDDVKSLREMLDELFTSYRHDTNRLHSFFAFAGLTI